MLLTSTFTEPLLVTHPRTGLLINIAPLFDLMEQIDGPTNSPADLQACIGQVIQTMALTVHDPQVTTPLHLAQLNYDLYRLETMFEQMIHRQAA